ncbi:hypothetical protein CSB07_01380 [Candidatus Gracilibacteria bacterium]|nr:MAG: hypothetical protein CSB07_01380 [Candidatus Gracilibacteria bacterium]PIE85068.1 MAG: hypothetical protein CSA08_03955 [Candidatus Gracilibacteria bacterium]
MKDNKPKIDNLFFDLIFFLLSFIFGIFKSIKIFFSSQGFKGKYKNYFYDFLNFIFKLWPSYFWKEPSFSKIISFFGDMINYVFLSSKKK